MPAPETVLRLVERFESNRDSYKSAAYNEAQTRREFIEPFFKALGWDVYNEQGYAEQWKEVVHEDALRMGGATKAPDYSFRLGGRRLFFLEAKKPAIDLKEDPASAFQLRRYAWTAKLALSILTNFEEFIVYDTRLRPAGTDTSAKARIICIRYDEYAGRWDEIASIFSPDAVRKGGFERFIESATAKRGTAEVDDAFLAEIAQWRELLAHNIALRNQGLSQRQLNYAVQATIDRIVFLRICEDRGIESYGRLQALLNGVNVYARLRELYRTADERYNSGLFFFFREKDRPGTPDELTPGLAIDDKVLKDIIRRLYYPDSPYEFSVLPAEVLGQVYERFLGCVIRLTGGGRAKVEEKPEVRKAGGVYYTPTYVVDYMVQHTVGRLLEGKTPQDVAGVTEAWRPSKGRRPLAVLDPACGSGSFLIGAYQSLLDWHLEQYAKEPEKWSRGRQARIHQNRQGGWALATAERKRILLANIFGVDIDSQAVEVTKLSLLLKVLEGENAETLQRQLALFHERALPDLAANIKCGNSLIGPDFYRGRQMAMFDEEEMYRVNAFDWDAEFPAIMRSGGFDAVIGNPPYIRVRIYKELFPYEAEYLEKHYSTAVHVWDVYLLVMEKAFRLLNNGGYLSFIVPIQTLHQPNCESIRRMLLSETDVTQVVDLARIQVFRGPVVKNCIITSRGGRHDDHEIEVQQPDSPEGLVKGKAWKWPQDSALANPHASLKVDLLSPRKRLCDKLRGQSWELLELCYSTFGLRSCAKGRGEGGKDRLITDSPRAAHAKPYLEGRDVSRFAMSPTGRFIRYIPDEMYSPRSPELFENRKIVSQSMLSRKRIVATLDDEGYYVEQSLVCILPNGIVNRRARAADVPLEYILGMINSTLEAFYFGTYIIDYSLGGGLIHATPGAHDKLIIPKAAGKQMAALARMVQIMLDLHKRLSNAGTTHEQTLLKRRIAATDREIDGLVYLLYGLTDDEIATVEESTAAT